MVAAFFSETKAKVRRQAIDDFKVQFGEDNGQDIARRMRRELLSGDHPILPFHWDIEFPEVFAGDNPGFDSIVGNPPFAGKNTIINGSRKGFLDWLKVISPGAHGNADLSAHFFRRAYGLLREGGTMGLIATDTIAQGDTRESGLEYLLTKIDAQIFNARKRVEWPSEAQTLISTVHICKGKCTVAFLKIDGSHVDRVSAFLREGVRVEMKAVAHKRRRFGYRRIGVMLERKGMIMNHKKLYRIALITRRYVL